MARRKVLIDVGPLRWSKDFRYLFFGEMVSLIGSGLTTVAVPFQLYSLTGSSLQVGLASLAQLLPLIACSFVGGAIADTYDRRRVLLVAELAMAGCSAALALNSTLGSSPKVWPLYVFSAASAGLSGIESPTRVAAAASVLDRSDMIRMSALFQALFQTSAIIGPFLAGIVISTAGLGAAYWVDVASFGAALTGAWLLRPLPPAHEVTALGLKAVKEGLHFLRRDRALQSVYLIDLAAMVLAMPRALFPVFGTVLFTEGRVPSAISTRP
jgi:MFS family permease